MMNRIGLAFLAERAEAAKRRSRGCSFESSLRIEASTSLKGVRGTWKLLANSG